MTPYEQGFMSKCAEAGIPECVSYGLLKLGSKPTSDGIKKLIRTFVEQTRSKPIPFTKMNGKVRKGLLVRGSRRLPSEEYIPAVMDFERRYNPVSRAYFVSANPLVSEPYASTVNGFFSYGNPKKVPFITTGKARFGPITDGSIVSHIWGDTAEAAKLNRRILDGSGKTIGDLYSFDSAEAVAPRLEWADAVSGSGGRVFKSVGKPGGIGLDSRLGKGRGGLPDIRSGMGSYSGDDIARAMYRDATAENALIRIANTYPEYRDMIYSAIRKYDRNTYLRLLEQTRPDKLQFGMGVNMINFSALNSQSGELEYGLPRRYLRLKRKFPGAFEGSVTKKKQGVAELLLHEPEGVRKRFIALHPQYAGPML